MNPRDAFLDAAVWHGKLEAAEAILAAHPEIASSDVHTAAILGDDTAVRRFIELDPANATAKSGPRNWDALTYLCFSKYTPPRPGAVRRVPAVGRDSAPRRSECEHRL